MSSTELYGKAAIVTGGARGIGRSIALRLATLGANVVIADVDLRYETESIDPDDNRTLSEAIQAKGLRQQCIEIEVDLTSRVEATRLIETTLQAFGRLDIVVNNAGGMLTSADTSNASCMSDEDLTRIFDVNLRSAIYVSQATTAPMRAQGNGAIINIASMAALDPSQRKGKLAHYGMAKSALVQFTRFLAHEVGPDGIRVNAIAPGTIATDRVMKQAESRGIGVASDLEQIPLRRFGQPEDIAGVVHFLATDLSTYVTGQCISVCGGRILTPS